MKTKRMMLVLLGVILLIFAKLPVYAEESVHVCNYSTWISYEYTSVSDYVHQVNVIKYSDCKDANCPIVYSEIQSTYNENHSYTLAWSGKEYHRGKYHYAYYAAKCTSCKHIDADAGEWRFWECPGGDGGTCILPKSVNSLYEIM